MAKVKNKKNSGLADKVRSKRREEASKKTLNPFEVHINREKFRVLGKKLKSDRGLPGVSRAKAMKKRKETIGVELKMMHKDNTFLDRRIGENNSHLSGEDKIVARFAAERAKQYSKKNIFNLADDVLTHRGQTLEEVEKFEDPRSSDEEDEDGRKFGGLSNKFVAEGHFGGGMLSKSDTRDGAKSHKDLIEQLIAESKKRKAEKQKLKEQTLDLTEKLDTDWKDLQPIVFKKKPEEEESLIDKLLSKEGKRGDDYDKMMRELRFEKRGTPSDGLKSEEKLAQEQKTKLEKLEKERLERMHGIVKSNINSAASNKHRSADDLEDNFEFDNEPIYMVAYDNDGKPLLPDHILKENSLKKKKVQFDNEGSGSDEEKGEDEDGEESEGESDEEVDSLNDLKESDESNASDLEDELMNGDDETNEKVDKVKNRKKTIEENGTMIDSSKPEKDLSTNFKRISSKNKHSESECDEVNEKLNITSNTKVLKISNHNETLNQNTNKLNFATTLAISATDGAEGSDSSKEGEIVNESKKAIGIKRRNSDIDDVKAKVVRKQTYDEASGGGDDNDVDTEQISIVPAVFLKPMTDLVEEIIVKEETKDLFDSSVVDEQIANQIKADLLARNVIMETARKELPYTYEMPEEYEQLEELLCKQPPEYQAVILERLIKCYHPSLAENNKQLLSKLFAYLLQYVNDVFRSLKKAKRVIKAFQVFDKIAPQIYELAQTNVMNAKHCLTEVIVEKYGDFKKTPKKVPDLDTLIFFKIVSLIFPTSDFRHPVVTPCLIFMSEILTKCKYQNAYSISRGLFVMSLVLEYTAMSKRFVPSAINFIRGVIFLSANTSILNPIQIVPPFKLFSKESKLLVLEEDCRKMANENKMSAKDLVSEVDSQFKVRSFATCVNMLKELFSNCNDLETQQCMFEPHIQLLGLVDLDYYPEAVRKSVTDTLAYMRASLEMRTYAPLAREKSRPKALKLYEPDVQDVFTGSKSANMSRELAEREKLKHRLKRETKGALREIRRDKAYIGAVKIKQKMHSDNIRKEKVKQIYKEASLQQGELNKLQRRK